jgi:hypothetical protein
VSTLGSQLIAGTTFPGTNSGGARVTLRTSPFHADVVAGPTALFTTPFSMTGTLTMRDPTGVELLNTALAGVGEARFTVRVNPGAITGFDTQDILFQFLPSSANPVPEPASIVLLGVSLAGCIARQSRLRNRRPGWADKSK